MFNKRLFKEKKINQYERDKKMDCSGRGGLKSCKGQFKRWAL
jgi:hypothetical protein